MNPGASPSRTWTWIARGGAGLSALLPFVLALSRAADTAQWRDDLALSRAAALAPTPGSGLVSTILLAVSDLLPLGTRAYRGAVLSAALLGVVALLVHRVALRALDEVVPAPRLNPFLAATAALTAALSPVLQREATVAGGAMPVVALSLASLALLPPPGTLDVRRFVGVGAVFVAVALESPATAVVLLFALALASVLRGHVQTKNTLAAGVGVVLVLALLGAPLLLRALSSRSWLEVGHGSRLAELVPLDVASLRARGIGAWTRDLGVVALALTGLGVAAAIARAWARWVFAPFAIILLADLLVPASSAGVLSADALAGVRALAVASAAVLSAVGVQAIATTLLATQLVFARPAAVLSVAFLLALAAVAGEESSFRADRTETRGAHAWTVEAVQRLPPSSILLVRADAVAWRLWTAQVTAGVRPDITLVPLPLLGRGRVASALLREEPALAPLLRDLATSGAPSEYALSSIADMRPLYVELDPTWDKRLAAHVTPEHLWLRFAPQPLGSSDRRLAQTDDAASLARVLAATRRDDDADEATLEVLAAHTREQLVAGSVVGDRDSMTRALGQLVTLRREPAVTDPIWAYVDPPKRIDPRRVGRR